MKLSERLIVLALFFAGIAYGIYWCINYGPCSSVCDYIPSAIQSLFGLCKGQGPGGAPCGAGGACASPGILAEFDNILNKLEAQTSSPQGCVGSDCVPDQPGQTSGMLSIGGS